MDRGRARQPMVVPPRQVPAEPVALSFAADPNHGLVLYSDEMQEIIRSVAQKPNVTSLSLQGNILPTRCVALLAAFVRTNRTLKELNLSQCCLGDSAAIMLIRATAPIHVAGGSPQHLVSKLHSINLSFNYLTDAVCHEIKRIATTTSLRKVSMAFNPITPAGVCSLISFNSCLTHVDVRYCDLPATDEEFLADLTTFLRDNGSVRVLRLDGNGFKKAQYEKLMDSIRTKSFIPEVSMKRAAGPLPKLKQLLQDFKSGKKPDTIEQEEAAATKKREEDRAAAEEERRQKEQEEKRKKREDSPKKAPKKDANGTNDNTSQDKEQTKKSKSASNSPSRSKSKSASAKPSPKKEVKKDDIEVQPEDEVPEEQHPIVDSEVVSEIAKVEGDVVAVRSTHKISSFDRVHRPRSFTNALLPKQVELLKPREAGSRSASAMDDGVAAGGRSASRRRDHSCGPPPKLTPPPSKPSKSSKADAETEKNPTTNGDAEHVGEKQASSKPNTPPPAETTENTEKPAEEPTADTSAEVAREGGPQENGSKPDEKDTAGKKATEEPKAEGNQEGDDEEPYVAPVQPQVVKAKRSRSSSAHSARSASAASRHVDPMANGHSGQSTKTQLRRGMVARMLLDRCLADDEQAKSILNMTSLDELKVGGGIPIDCPEELLNVSAVPSELQVKPMNSSAKVDGIAKMLFFIFYAPGERLPVEKVASMPDLPPTVRSTSKEDQAHYRSIRSVENTKARKRLQAIIGENAMASERSPSMARSPSRSADSAAIDAASPGAPVEASKPSSRSISRASSAKALKSVRPRYMDSYNQERKERMMRPVVPIQQSNGSNHHQARPASARGRH